MKNALIDPTTIVYQITGWQLNSDTSSPTKYVPIWEPIENSARVAEGKY